MAYRVPEPEEVLDLANRLKGAKETVQLLQSQWEALFAPTADVATATDEEYQRPSTLADRIIALLEGQPDESFSAGTVALRLEAKQTSVASILSRLVAENRLIKDGHSTYRAKRESETALTEISDDDIPF